MEYCCFPRGYKYFTEEVEDCNLTASASVANQVYQQRMCTVMHRVLPKMELHLQECVYVLEAVFICVVINFPTNRTSKQRPPG